MRVPVTVSAGGRTEALAMAAAVVWLVMPAEWASASTTAATVEWEWVPVSAAVTVCAMRTVQMTRAACTIWEGLSPLMTARSARRDPVAAHSTGPAGWRITAARAGPLLRLGKAALRRSAAGIAAEAAGMRAMGPVRVSMAAWAVGLAARVAVPAGWRWGRRRCLQ